jgi:uncharacterized cupin superfamily protein
MSRPNAFTAQFNYEDQEPEPPGYACAEVPYGKAVGGKDLAVRLFELPPGERLCPYHYEYVEEWLIVMVGEVKVRIPSGVESLTAGEVMCFPAGAEGAHKVWNDSQQPARIVMFSQDSTPAVAVYPDSDKVGVWGEGEKWMFRGTEGHLEYYDGDQLDAH